MWIFKVTENKDKLTMKLNKEESLIYVLKQIRKLINMAIGDEVTESHALEPRKDSYGAKQNKRNNLDKTRYNWIKLQL